MSESDTSAQRASSAVLRYGLAVSSVAAALILTLVLRPDALVAPIFFLAPYPDCLCRAKARRDLAPASA